MAISPIYHLLPPKYTFLNKKSQAPISIAQTAITQASTAQAAISQTPNFSFGTAFLGIKFIKAPILYLDYFLNHFKKDPLPAKISNIIYFFADLTASIQYFTEVAITKFANLSTALGLIRILSKTVSYLSGISYLFWGVNAAVSLAKGTLSPKEQRIAWLDLAMSVLQVALFVLFIAGSLTPGLQLGLAIASYTLWAATLALRYIPCPKKTP